ncbi:peptidase [Streptomyces sp. NPDC000594]|uniref:peptidase n=1 Tax=Streptomyces sp. NPDC000594 TaxID=3154261 RepID=UPI003317DAAA
MRARTGVTGLMAAVCAGILLAPSPAVSAPAPQGGSEARSGAKGVIGDPGAAFWAKHKRVGEVADALVAAAGKLPRQGGGYGGLITAPKKSAITLYWKGTVPAPVRQAMRSDRRVTVKVAPAPYTRHQLMTARDRVFKQQSELPGRLTGIGPSPDGKGLLIGMAPERGKNTLARKAPAAVARGVADITGGIAVVKVEASSPESAVGKAPLAKALLADKRMEAFAVGRNGQQAYGGAAWVYKDSAGTHFCTTGFAVQYTASPGTQRMSSAAHCGTPNGPAHSPEYPTSRPFGRMHTHHYNRDISIMNAAQAGANNFFQPSIWLGPWRGQPSGQSRKAVADLGNNHVGQYVCSSGAISGSLCGIRIVATDQIIPVDGPAIVYNGVKVAEDHGLAIWGSGDSGGPIVGYLDSRSVHANGIISASDKKYGATCNGYSNRKCASVGWYAPLEGFLQDWGLQLIVQ